MTISSDYFQYLEHFRKTCTLNYFYKNKKKSNLIALRHDIDHDIDIALEMAYFEYKSNIKSTYFVLPELIIGMKRFS